MSDKSSMMGLLYLVMRGEEEREIKTWILEDEFQGGFTLSKYVFFFGPPDYT